MGFLGVGLGISVKLFGLPPRETSSGVVVVEEEAVQLKRSFSKLAPSINLQVFCGIYC